MTTIKTMEMLANRMASLPGDAWPGMTHAAYGAGLLEPRTRGSLTERPFTALDEGLELEVFEAPCVRAGNTAYQCRGALELGGVVGAKPLNRLTRQELNRVKLRLGDHGPELYVDVSEASLEPTDVLTFLVEEAYKPGGEGEGHRILAGWFPGYPVGDVSDEIRDEFTARIQAGEDLQKLRTEFLRVAPVDVGVKLHNG